MTSDIGIVILAAGLGTRMKSGKAKVLHKICGHAMVEYVVRVANDAVGENVVVVVGHQADQVEATVRTVGTARFALQERQLGTGHAVRCAIPELAPDVKHVVVLCGDVPLIQPQTIKQLIDDHRKNQRTITLLAVEVKDPKGYGRVIIDGQGRLTAIIEEADADEAQKRVSTINSGIYAIERAYLEDALPRLRADNAQKEIYLTDIVGLGYSEQKRVGVVIGQDSREVIGVNSQEDLQVAEKIMKQYQGEKS